MHLSKKTQNSHLQTSSAIIYPKLKLLTCNILLCQFLITHFSNLKPHIAIVIGSRELHTFVLYFMFSMISNFLIFQLSFKSVHFQIILARGPAHLRQAC